MSVRELVGRDSVEKNIPLSMLKSLYRGGYRGGWKGVAVIVHLCQGVKSGGTV